MRALAYSCAAVLLLWPESARPCSPAPCNRGGYIVPAATFPTQLPGIVWTPHQGYGGVELDESEIVLQTSVGVEYAITVVDRGTSPASFLIMPNAPFAPNTTYELQVPSTCPDRGPETRFFSVKTSVDVPMPAELGTLRISRSERGMLTTAAAAARAR